MYQQIYKKSHFSSQTEQNIAIINVMTLELEPASIVFSRESSVDFPELQRALFKGSQERFWVLKDSCAGILAKYPYPNMWDTYIGKKKTMPSAFHNSDISSAWEATSFLSIWKRQLFYYFHLLSQLKPVQQMLRWLFSFKLVFSVWSLCKSLVHSFLFSFFVFSLFFFWRQWKF